jgi:hypothetical protein
MRLRAALATAPEAVDVKRIADKWRHELGTTAMTGEERRMLLKCLADLSPPAPKPDVAERAFEEVVGQRPGVGAVFCSTALDIARRAVELDRQEREPKPQAAKPAKVDGVVEIAESIWTDRMGETKPWNEAPKITRDTAMAFMREAIRSFAAGLDAEKIIDDLSKLSNITLLPEERGGIRWAVAHIKSLAGVKGESDACTNRQGERADGRINRRFREVCRA